MIQDDVGNKIFRVKNKIFLRLISEERSRLLATIDEGTRELRIYRKHDKHLHMKTIHLDLIMHYLKMPL